MWQPESRLFPVSYLIFDLWCLIHWIHLSWQGNLPAGRNIIRKRIGIVVLGCKGSKDRIFDLQWIFSWLRSIFVVGILGLVHYSVSVSVSRSWSELWLFLSKQEIKLPWTEGFIPLLLNFGDPIFWEYCKILFLPYYTYPSELDPYLDVSYFAVPSFRVTASSE